MTSNTPLAPLPVRAADFAEWQWPQIQPYYDELSSRELTAGNVSNWLADWSRLMDLLSESYNRLSLATTVNTADAQAEQRYNKFLDTIYPSAQAADQKLKEKLLASGLDVPGMEIPLRNMRAEAELFRSENLPLLSEEQKLSTEYQKIIGAQTVMWEGQEVTIMQLAPVYLNPDRSVREHAWRLAAERQLADRAAVTAVWQKLLTLRQKLATNAGYDNYRDYRWRQLLRFDYTPQDCASFHNAIEQVVVPAATRVYERGRKRLGLDRLRPWDLIAPQGFGQVVNPPDVPTLHPFEDVSELIARCATMFQNVDPQLGAYFDTMRQEELLDLANRKNKAPGAYCTTFEATGRPFIFANAVGLQRDVETVLHEGGHAFHVFEARGLPYHQQRSLHMVPMEFGEVASMGMELLASPYLAAKEGGFYTEKEAARARRSHLEGHLFFWPYMAVIDAFQHWVYENLNVALDPSNCDAQWQSLWKRFMPGVDWSGLESVSESRWQRQLHIFSDPFYYVEYGMAQLGAVQVWRNALSNQADAVAAYRRALAQGATASLPALYKAAGVKFAFDAETLGQAVELIEKTLDELNDE